MNTNYHDQEHDETKTNIRKYTGWINDENYKDGKNECARFCLYLDSCEDIKCDQCVKSKEAKERMHIYNMNL